MSSLIFPQLSGLGWDVLRTPVWDTEVQTALSGKTSTLARRAYPIIRYSVKYNVLRDVGAAGYSSSTSEVLQIVGLFNAVQGRFDTWLYTDPDFNAVTAQLFATADGTSGPFQLVATYQNAAGPGYNELVQNLNGAPQLFDNGSLISPTHYSIDGTGRVLFSVNPANGHLLTWTGSFYYRCRFDEDTLELSKMMKALWEIKKLGFASVKL